MDAIARRIAAEQFEPERAPHRPLVRELIVEHLPPLQGRLRGKTIDELVREVILLEQSPIPLIEEAKVVQVAHLAQRVLQVIQALETRERALVREFRNFGTLYSQVEEEAQRRRLIVEYLNETVQDPKQLRGDLAAMRRHFGYDTLRERNNRAVLHCSVLIELGLLYLARAVPVVAAGRGSPDGDEALAGLRDARLHGFCVVRLVGARRWQVRWAAGQAAVAVTEHLPPDPPVVGPEPGADALELTRGVARHRDEHPWVQAAALEATVLAQPYVGRDLLAERLTTPGGELDHHVRKLAVAIAARRLPAEEANALVAQVVAARDPSEHVRLGLVDSVASLTWDAAGPLLATLGGITEPREPSPKVRARVAIVARRLAAAAYEMEDEIADRTGRSAADLLVAITADPHPFPLQVGCEELAALAADLAPDRPELLDALAPGWLAALHRLIAADDTAPRIAEIAAAAAEAIERERDPLRRELRHEIAEVIARIPPGGEGYLDLAALPAPLDEAARDPAMLGRALADVTRTDWGVSASPGRDRVRIWRGDRFRRRLWRILHELRHPLPNKRQGWVHTVGRVYPGALRAHAGALDEATATTVPGERVTVDSEGSWARHLPQVDDVLDLPVLRARPVHVVSSLGTSTIEPPPSLWKRLKNRVAISWHYRTLAGLRLSSLRAYKDRNRRRYIEELESRFAVKVRFEPHARPVATEAPAPAAPAAAELFALAAGPIAALQEFLDTNRTYFLSPTQNSQTALVAFGAALASGFFAKGWQKRRQVTRARASIPLSLGGWGTRGKSGTERLKAGLLDGLGYQVFVKTTGCEAMFIHSSPMQQPVEIFIYRPYDKATIWEQMAMVLIGARLRTEAFLWECMALNPKYVQLLQHDWMNDDLVTLTNCYPDHEDIQGPAGFDVAKVITEFIPTRSTLVTSETSYLPLFEQVCKQRGTTMHTIGERDAELIADDVLDLFPYREHPRNIALVTRVAEELGIDADLARLTMAQSVVPDLGVLKAYPKARVRGRYLTFVCGNSANERTGFINNWRRMKLDQLDLEQEPHRLVVTVVNNRADRIARSEVFARILVRDVAFDRHVLIGTNLEGLRVFLDAALTDYLRELSLIEPDELVKGAVPPVVAARVGREIGNLRIPPPVAESALLRLAIYARPAGLVIDPGQREALAARLDVLLGGGLDDGSLDIDRVRKDVAADRELDRALRAALVAAPEPAPDDDWPETLEPPTADDALAHLGFELARMQIRARLEARLARLFDAPGEAARVAFRADFAAAYRAMFLAQVYTVEDAGASGDQIIERCARQVPPGTDVTLMGTQNIKGTGLDFVYRWLALDLVVRTLRDQQSPREDRRLAALAELEGFEDHGLVDTGLARAILARPPAHRPTPDEAAARQRIASKVEAIWARRKTALVEQKKAGLLDRIARWGEGWLDWVDSIHRTHASRRIVDDLVDQRISHGRASIEMRKLVGRIKGGWLIKMVRGK